ncbi:hypothetical protein HF086_004540 [Spodoptera exigua]|uniref:Catalase core domain-containing protein n=1 Tax=Spodoptera exigua TaxID=7107 RepID=A0A922SCG1_SPOEX|nr:hypothetical protein HF086_004540 [Spodoptera exigua]
MFLKTLPLFMVIMVTMAADDDPAGNQIILFKNRTVGPIAIMTTAAGAPIEYQFTISLNKPLLYNEFLMDSLTHATRERIPERVVHAKAAGAFGYFEVTHDISDICRAKLFKLGEKTPIAARFSLVITERGGSDTVRDLRGFAVKFYTEDGNFDIVGLNTPMYAYKDPILFPTFVRSQKRNPATDLYDPNTLWDYLTINPESFHLFLLYFSDRGIPDGYRHMPGFSIHTYQVVNNNHSENHFVRFHFQPDAGIKYIFAEEARRLAGTDTEYATRDLYNAIGTGNYPSSTASIQVLTESDVKNASFDVFDVTKVLPQEKYPLKPLGRLVLNRNPINYFAEIEQLAFCPANLVDGILGSPDKVFEARRLAYRDAQYYRLGANFLRIPVNCPLRHKAYPYNRDGVPPLNDNLGDIPNYYPNSFNGPVPYVDNNVGELIEIYEDKPNNFDQARDLYMNEFSAEEKRRLVENIVHSLKKATGFLQERAIKIFRRIHPGVRFTKAKHLYNREIIVETSDENLSVFFS